MANYESTFRTNYFRTSDDEKYAELFKGIYGESLEDFTMNIDGVLWHGFGGYGSVGWCADPNDEPDCDDLSGFYAELQKILPDDEAFILMEAGAEKLRYVTGYADIVTAHSYDSVSLSEMARHTARKLLGNPEFQTRLEY